MNPENLPDLSPTSNQPSQEAVPNWLRKTDPTSKNSAYDPPPKGPEVFVNPSPPPTEPETTSSKKKFLVWGAVAVSLLILITIVGFIANELVFNRITTLSLVPDSTEYYLTLSVKEHPQAKKAKELVNKLPGGKKMLENLDKYYSELLGPKDPFEDIVRLSKEEIFLAKLYPEKSGESSFGSFDKLLNIVEFPRPKEAKESIAKFRKDPEIYQISDEPYEGQNILNIKLKEKSSSAQKRYDLGPLPSRVTLPLSEGIFATSVKNFIVAGEKVADVKKSIDLAKVKSIFGFKRSELKSLQDDQNHQKIAKYFPKETLLRFYQNQPLSPFGDFLPEQSLSQSFIVGQDVRSDEKESSDTYKRLPRGLAITAHDDGVRMNSYQLDIKTPDSTLKNPFKIEESLASRLPKQFSGIPPAFYGETKNYYQIYKDQIDQIKDLAENADNRKQRESFKEALKYLDDGKREFRKYFGIDYEDDLLAYLESNVASIYNGGSAKKSPEFLIVADIKEKDKVEKSLSKIKIPNYLGEIEKRVEEANDRLIESDIRQVATALSVYFTKNIKYPKALKDLKPDYTSYLPENPKTKKPYKYTISGDQKTAKVEAKLNDGRTVYWDSSSGQLKYIGTKKKTEIPAITPKKNTYKKINIYSLNLYKYEKFSFNMFFAVSDNKLVILFGDVDRSLKEILDFEPKGGAVLASGENWKTQFNDKGEIGGFIYVEPIQFWGVVDYVVALYPQYKQFISKDLELTIKGYLKSLRSIGTVVDKEGPVHVTTSFIQVVELPKDEKEKVENAVQRLLDADKKGDYSSVLGVETSKNNWELWKERIKRLFVPK